MSARPETASPAAGDPRGVVPAPLPPALSHGDARSFRVLRLDLDLGWESAPYNQLTLPLMATQRITYSTYFRVPIDVPAAVDLVGGDSTLGGYVRALWSLRRRGFDLVHAHAPHVAVVFLAVRRILGLRDVPTLYTVHNCYGSYRPRNKLLMLPVFAAFDRVVCCGRASYDSFPVLYRRLAGTRLRHVPNGVDLDRIDRALAAVGPGARGAGGRFRILTIGRLVPIKNQAALIRAFHRSGLEDAELLVVGRGPLRSRLESVAGGPATARAVRFAGQVPRDRVFERAAAADLFVSTSRGEGLPVAVLEAMACGCPVLLSDIGPHREIADRTDAIPLIDPDDEAGFARELRRFRALTPAERARIGAECRRVVEEGFGLDAMLAGYDRLYAELARREGAP